MALTATHLARHIHYLQVLLTGHPLHGREQYRPFFIVGSGRSGTTLLRAMLQAHPDVHIPPENYGFGTALPAYRRYSRLPWGILLRVVLTHFEYHPQWEPFEFPLAELFRDLAVAPRKNRHFAGVIDALYRAHARRYKPSATRWGDKTPINSLLLAELCGVFPDMQVVQIIRDGRDVVTSFLRLPGYDLHRAAHQWVQYVHATQTFGARHPSQYLEVRYEDLIAHPRETVEAVARFLGLDVDERMLRHHELDLWLGDVDRIPHLQGVRRPVYSTSIGRWRKDLSPEQIAELTCLLGPMLAGLGYGGVWM